MTTSSILVVEDDRIIARGIEKRLKGMGFVVAGLAASGEEAIRMATDSRPDLVLMDIHLGAGLSGIEASQEIRRLLDVPIVYLTAHSDNATLQRAKLTEPFGYILKPYEDKDLQIAIEIGLYKHRMERRLRENEQWLAATLASIGDGVIATDEAGRVRLMNSVAERLTGWPQADAAGKDVREVFQIFEESTGQPVSNPAIEAMQRGHPVELAPRTLLRDRIGVARPIDDNAAPIRDPEGAISGSVLIFRDITERHRLEAHLRQAQKLDALGRLAGGIAHDFNNIITVIIGFSELLLDDHLTAQHRQEFVHTILDAGKRASSLTQQILAFSRKQPVLVSCPFDLNAVLKDMGTMVKRLIGEDIEFSIALAPDLPLVNADPAQVSQVILNLATNARDAMPLGGQLIFSTSTRDVSVPPAHSELKPGRYVVLSVADTGCGMSGEVQKHLFEPFFTTKEIGKGTGLGLAASYGIVKQSEGHIEVTSQEGKGTTFRLYFPVAERARTDAGSSEPVAMPTGTETILLLEDEASVRSITRLALERSGYRVLEAANGEEALSLSANYSGPIHLLITDLVMPLLSGRSVAERLTVDRPAMRVLFISGYPEDRNAQQTSERTTAELLHKPYHVETLSRKVREVLDR